MEDNVVTLGPGSVEAVVIASEFSKPSHSSTNGATQLSCK